VTTVEELAAALLAAGDAGSADLVVVRGVEEVAVAVHFDQAAASQQGSA
jgi:hypothetical protein